MGAPGGHMFVGVGLGRATFSIVSTGDTSIISGASALGALSDRSTILVASFAGIVNGLPPHAASVNSAKPNRYVFID